MCSSRHGASFSPDSLAGRGRVSPLPADEDGSLFAGLCGSQGDSESTAIPSPPGSHPLDCSPGRPSLTGLELGRAPVHLSRTT